MVEMYDDEPNTSGRVILYTSLGEIEIHLYSNECPSACHNFIQLCYNNYYNNNKFFKVLPYKYIQTGDHTNTGFHFEYAFGRPFGSEFHEKIRFNESGCVGFAKSFCLTTDTIQKLLEPLEIAKVGFPWTKNALTLNTGTLAVSGPGSMNGSQFFITLAEIKEYDYSRTLFGKVAKHSLPVLFKFNEVKINKYGDPIDRAPFIKRAVVVENPYNHIVPFRDYEQEFRKSRGQIDRYFKGKDREINDKLKTLKELSFKISRNINILGKKIEEWNEEKNDVQSTCSDMLNNFKNKKRKIDDFLKYKEAKKEEKQKKKELTKETIADDPLRAIILSFQESIKKKRMARNANNRIKEESSNDKKESTDLQITKINENDTPANHIDDHISSVHVEKKKKSDEPQKGSNYTLFMETPTLLVSMYKYPTLKELL